jgi:hypothetical protein
LKADDLRGKTKVAEKLTDVYQTAAFSLSATSPRTLSVRELSTCRIQLFSVEPTTVFQTVAFVKFDRKITGCGDDGPTSLGTHAEKPRESGSH